MLRRTVAPELLDARDYRNQNELRQNLDDMARYGCRLGAFGLALALATRSLPDRGAFTGLDVGIGAGDFIRFARAHVGVCIAWTGVDLSLDALQIAQESTPAELLCAAGQCLPFADASFDVVTCLHTLHHLDPPQAGLLLGECVRVARRRVVVLDLARGYFALVGAWLLTRGSSRNRLTRADGVRSVLRAYTPDEVRALAQSAGLREVCVRRHGPFRLSATWTKAAMG